MPTNTIAATPEEELLVVQEAARLITKSTDPKPAVQGILRILSQLLGLNRGRVLLPSGKNNQLEILYSYGLTDNEKSRGSYQIGEGITGKVYQTGQLALIQDIDEEPLYLNRAVDRSTLPDEAVAFIAVPIIINKNPAGVLATHRLRHRARPFQRDLALLQVIATLIGQVLQIHKLVEKQTANLINENKILKNKLESQGIRYGIIGQSDALQQSILQALQVASTGTTVLLLGESGTGKERFARMQHLASERSSGPFVSINCAAIPASLIESELFGHEKGSFTGATAMKRGKIELASNGTLFLDEIGDLDMELQAKLLKVLEHKMIQRVGSTKDISIDVRIVAATHKNLQEAVNDNRFRLDLFYRLNIFPIRLPPLRSRTGDIPLLCDFFLNTANQEFSRHVTISDDAIEVLDNYSWPGNIRQLENLIKRAVLMSTDASVSRELIKRILLEEGGINMPAPQTLSTIPESSPYNPEFHHTSPSSLDGLRPYAKVSTDDSEKIIMALKQHQGNKTRAAISLGMTPRQLRYRIKKLQLPV